MHPYFSLTEAIATSTSSTVDDDHRSAHLDHDSKDSLRKSVESLFNKLYGMCKFLIHYPVAINIILLICICNTYSVICRHKPYFKV